MDFRDGVATSTAADTSRCSCGARLGSGMTWCPQCHQQISAALPAEPKAGRRQGSWERPASSLPVLTEPQARRFPLTRQPWFRLVVSIAVLLPAVIMYFAHRGDLLRIYTPAVLLVCALGYTA